MKDANEYHGNKGVPQRRTLTAGIAGMTLVLICLVAPAPAATFQDQLQEFLQGQPFEFIAEFQGLKPTIDVAKAPAATFQDQLQEFLQGPPFEFPVEF